MTQESNNSMKKEIEKLVSNEAIDKAWGYANFGNVSKRDVIVDSLLKCASGYQTGHTAKCIVIELGLVTTKWTLTKLGKLYLYESYKDKIIA